MKKRTLGIIAVSVLGAAAIFCSAIFMHQYLDAKNSKATFDDLTNLITEIDKPQKATEAEESGLSEEELAAAEAALAREKYDALFAQNNDFIGWIKIDGTNVNYRKIISLPKRDMDLLTLIAFEGYSQREVAEIRGIAPAAICKKIAKLKKLLYGG